MDGLSQAAAANLHGVSRQRVGLAVAVIRRAFEELPPEIKGSLAIKKTEMVRLSVSIMKRTKDEK